MSGAGRSRAGPSPAARLAHDWGGATGIPTCAQMVRTRSDARPARPFGRWCPIPIGVSRIAPVLLYGAGRLKSRCNAAATMPTVPRSRCKRDDEVVSGASPDLPLHRSLPPGGTV